MKKLLTAAAILSLVIAAVSQSQDKPSTKTQVVVLQAGTFFYVVSGENEPSTYKWGGARIQNMDTSISAPRLLELPTTSSPYGYEGLSTNGYAETLAQYMDRGFEHLSTSADGLTTILVKKPKL